MIKGLKENAYLLGIFGRFGHTNLSTGITSYCLKLREKKVFSNHKSQWALLNAKISSKFLKNNLKKLLLSLPWSTH